MAGFVFGDGFFSCDVAIVGTGVGGLYCALNLPETLSVALFTKAAAEECDSYLAQGGICMLRDDGDYDSYFEDTMRAGHWENTKESVDIMIRSSRDVISDLVSYGTQFEKEADGSLAFTREGAHSVPRILFHEDVTGREITSHLLSAVRKLRNVRVFENADMLDIIEKEDGSCGGIIVSATGSSPLAKSASARNFQGRHIVPVTAKRTVWACGGIGGLFAHSTNYPHLTGDALAISLRRGIHLKDVDYIQIHPTTLYSKKPGRAFLVSESVRGEGGILLDAQGKRFTDELQPRDVVSGAIFRQMEKDGTPFVRLSMERIPKDVIMTHFRHIYERCLDEGFDCTKEPIPVVPAQHYFMGGVAVDSDSLTSKGRLYAVGETSCNGVHGRNRLASNSLLESLVFAKRAALNIASGIGSDDAPSWNGGDLSAYMDEKSLADENRAAVLAEIERAKKARNG